MHAAALSAAFKYSKQLKSAHEHPSAKARNHSKGDSMNDALRRGIRTFLQAALGVIALQAGALILDSNDGAIDWSLWQRVAVTAIVAGVIALVSWGQNVLEDSGTVKPLLKGDQ